MRTVADTVTLARKSHEHLLRTRDRALREADWAREQIASTERCAHEAFDEQRRLQDRLTAVVAAAASLGVPVAAINAALGTHYRPVPPTPEEGSDV